MNETVITHALYLLVSRFLMLRSDAVLAEGIGRWRAGNTCRLEGRAQVGAGGGVR